MYQFWMQWYIFLYENRFWFPEQRPYIGLYIYKNIILYIYFYININNIICL